ncbi:MAG: 16S rRNA (adenine(1518)-N(6)/adenine(1519)-N(6))-dimethyltransferase RsmA [Phycisphaerae bacterium]|nr:16S rRNA (adenine(1518)-N(6)/adenine(1519)-N(6))-dimethyltransferase RsmA [Phycisphaerae bacterium]
MQTLSEIREILSSAGCRPRRSLGQNFLIDAKLMGKLLELADLPVVSEVERPVVSSTLRLRPDGSEVEGTGRETVLEVGAATGSLTEELIARAASVVAVELDRSLAEILRRRVGKATNLVILNRDVLAGKHKIAPEVLDALAGAGQVHLVANLPYNISVPLIMNCLVLSWQVEKKRLPAPFFSRLTFTVQREVAERLSSGPGSKSYGPASVIVALLTRITCGRAIPPEAFWPRPKVDSRMLRLDFDAKSARRLVDIDSLSAVLSATFGHRRKMISAAAKHKSLPFPPERFASALAEVGIDPSVRPEQVSPQSFLALSNLLSDVDAHESSNVVQ